MNRVFVVGVGMTKFEKPGRKEGWDYPQMAQESGSKALTDAGIDYTEVEQGYVGYVAGDSTCGQRALYELEAILEARRLITARQSARLAATLSNLLGKR